MRAVILALTCAFLETVVAQRIPTTPYIWMEQIKNIGETVELRCVTQYAQDNPVLWVKVNRENPYQQVILSRGTTLLIRGSSRFAIRYDTASATYVLQIKNIQETDAAFYECRIQPTVNNHISAEVKLQVRRPPIISDNSTQSLVVSEGRSIMLECYASGFPQPKISWSRENNAILPTGGSIYRGNTLKIPAIRKEDRGTYYCVADNGVGSGATRNINVEVEFAS